MNINYTKETKRDIYRQQLEKELKELIDPVTGRVSMDVAKLIKCPLCKTSSFDELFIVKGFPYVRCKSCGLVYANPQVIEEKLYKLYGESKANDLWLDVITSEKESISRYCLYNRYFDLLEQFTNFRKLLDFGCSIGDLMMVANERGWETIGFDISKKAINIAQKKGLKCYLGKFEDFNFKPESFPVVTLTGVLEHLNAPIKILKKIRKVLINKGLLLVQVPNLHSLHNIILHEKSTSFDGRNHLIFFTPSTLKKALEITGFTIKHIRTYQAVTHVICRYIQFYDPYHGKADFSFLPEKIRSWFENEKKHNQLIKWLEDLGMGRSIVVIAQK